MKHSRCWVLAVALVALLGDSRGAEAQAPDRRGEVAIPATEDGRVPSYQGVRPNAPVPPHMHKRNEGGSDGAGLCVITSLIIDGRYQGLPAERLEKLWQTAKARPGGYSPQKLEALLRQVMPEEKYLSSVGRDDAVLERLSALGFPVGATMNTGQLYSYRQIAHMISLIHYKRGQFACVVDNNHPGFYHWMPATEFLKRWVDDGIGWAFAWTRKPPIRITPQNSSVPAALLLLAASVVVVRTRQNRSAA